MCFPLHPATTTVSVVVVVVVFGVVVVVVVVVGVVVVVVVVVVEDTICIVVAEIVNEKLLPFFCVFHETPEFKWQGINISKHLKWLFPFM